MQSESLEFSLLSIFSFLSFFTFFIIQKFSHKIMDGLLLDSDFDKPQAFHKSNVPRSGGLACLISFFIFATLNNLLFSSFYVDYLVLGTGLFLIGFLDDIKFRLSPKVRLATMTAILLVSVKVFSVQIYGIDLRSSGIFFTTGIHFGGKKTDGDIAYNYMINNDFISATEKFFRTGDQNYPALYRNQENVKFVLDAMFRSTNELYGTSFSSRIEDPKYQFAGKTGTAQVKRITDEERELDLKTNQIPYRERDHAWYIAFGPYKDPRYAVSILVEHGGSGSTTAAPIAKKLFKFVIDRHELREEIKIKI